MFGNFFDFQASLSDALSKDVLNAKYAHTCGLRGRHFPVLVNIHLMDATETFRPGSGQDALKEASHF